MKKNNNKGFSLVELIVVIAIMAIMVGVLAPTLMRYVEKARVSKDISALGEVKNAIQLAAAEESVFNAIRDKGTAGQTVVVKMATKTEAQSDANLKAGYYKFITTVPADNDSNPKGSKLEAEVAKTISEIQLTSTGLKDATITFTAKESNGAVTITVAGTGVAGEAVTPFAEAFTN